MRLGVAFVLLSIVFSNWSSSLVPFDQRVWVQPLAWAYALAGLVLFVAHWQLAKGFYWHWVTGGLIDVIGLSLIVYSTGPRAGLAPLIPIMVAGASVPVRPRWAISLAAAASLALLAVTVMRSISFDETDTANFLVAGLVGASSFLAAATMSWLATRLQAQELLAEARGQNLRTQLSVTRRVILELEQGVVLMDTDSQIRLLNPAAERMLGQAQLGGTMDKLGPAWAALIKTLRSLPPQSEHSFELGLPVPGSLSVGALRQVRVRVLEIQGGDTAHLASIQGEHKLERLLVSDDVGPLDTLILLEDVQSLQDRAQQLKLAAMGRLSASIAHEIRNPLGAIRHANSLLAEQLQVASTLPPIVPAAGFGGSDTLAEGGKGSGISIGVGIGVDSEAANEAARLGVARLKQQARLAKIIEDNTVRINTIVEDVLAIARRDRAQVEPIHLAAYLPSLLEEHLAYKQLDAARVKLVLSVADVCWFDAGHLRQILVNLLDNALRFAPSSEGAVKLEWARSGAGRLQLSVADAGPGIDAEQIEHVFEPFYTTHSQGTGLGLFLVREWCLANQAEIGYQRLTDSSIYSGAFIIEPDSKAS
jgi:two-component system, NtrC family, sensor histidine kinase PilS